MLLPLAAEVDTPLLRVAEADPVKRLESHSGLLSNSGPKWIFGKYRSVRHRHDARNMRSRRWPHDHVARFHVRILAGRRLPLTRSRCLLSWAT
jgi:hypothetical protein